ncbi:MAG: RNA-binding domain-containing protein [Nitrosopumilus sp.]
MRIPNIHCAIEIFCLVNPSENPNKIKTAISNIFPYSTIKSENSSILAKSNNLNSLEKIYEIIHSRQAQKTYKQNLEKNLERDTTWFYLNKQAAVVKKIAICEQSNESPLGPIKVVLTSSNIDKVINWLVFGDNVT